MREKMKRRNENDRNNYDENYELAKINNLILIDGGNITYNNLKSGPKTKSLKPEEIVRAKVYASLIYKYGYPIDRIDFEVTVQNLSTGFADIVIYDEQNRVIAVIETKKENCSDEDYNEAINRQYYYAFNLTATYYIIDTLDTYNEYLVFDESGEQTKGAKIETTFPNYNETISNNFKYIKGLNEIASIDQENLNYIVKQIFDMIKGKGVRTNDDALHVLTQIIFVKSMDELYTNDNEHYKCQIGSNESGNLVQVTQRFNNIYSERYLHTFLNDYPIIDLDNRSLYKIINSIQSFSLIKTDAEIRRKAFEYLLSLVYKQEFGQFFTHRNIIKFCVYCMSIKEDSNICDPACGTGGFLIMSYLRMLDCIRVSDALQKASRQNTALNRLHGYEINQNISRIAKFNIFLTSLQFDSQGIENKDSLLKNNNQENQEKQEIKYDFVFTNPPFGSSVSKTEGHKDYKLFKEGKQFSDILFIEHCINILKEGDESTSNKSGSMVIVLPEGILNNDSLKYVRRYIQQQAFVKAVVSLPIHAFKKAGAGAKTSLVFLEKYTKQCKEIYDDMFSQKKASAENKKKQLEEGVRNTIVSFLQQKEFEKSLSVIATPYSEYIEFVKKNYDVDKKKKECKIKVEGQDLQDAINRFKQLPKYQSIYHVGDIEDESKTLYDIYDNIRKLLFPTPTILKDNIKVLQREIINTELYKIKKIRNQSSYRVDIINRGRIKEHIQILNRIFNIDIQEEIQFKEKLIRLKFHPNEILDCFKYVLNNEKSEVEKVKYLSNISRNLIKDYQTEIRRIELLYKDYNTYDVDHETHSMVMDTDEFNKPVFMASTDKIGYKANGHIDDNELFNESTVNTNPSDTEYILGQWKQFQSQYSGCNI